MNPEIKQLWIEALRSGKYKQGKNILYNIETNEYCCLGVLCDLAKENGIVEMRRNEYKYMCVFISLKDEYDRSMSSLPTSVSRWAGINSRSGKYIDSKQNVKDLTKHNDDEGKSFSEIASIINKYF